MGEEGISGRRGDVGEEGGRPGGGWGAGFGAHTDTPAGKTPTVRPQRRLSVAGLAPSPGRHLFLGQTVVPRIKILILAALSPLIHRLSQWKMCLLLVFVF